MRHGAATGGQRPSKPRLVSPEARVAASADRAPLGSAPIAGQNRRPAESFQQFGGDDNWAAVAFTAAGQPGIEIQLADGRRFGKRDLSRLSNLDYTFYSTAAGMYVLGVAGEDVARIQLNVEGTGAPVEVIPRPINEASFGNMRAFAIALSANTVLETAVAMSADGSVLANDPPRGRVRK